MRLIKQLTLLFFFLKSFTAFSCECMNEFTEFTPYDLVMYNRVVMCKPVSVDTVEYFLYYKAIVFKTYWGPKKDTVTIQTGRNGSYCGLELDTGSTYLIFGTGTPSIFITHCGPTRNLTKMKYGAELNSVDTANAIRMAINGVRGYYKPNFIENYLAKTAALEIKYLDSISTIKNGKLITRFYNDSVSAELTFKDGKLNGHAVFYYANGKKILEGNFIDNKKQGTWTEYTYRIIRGKQFYLSRTGNYIDDKKKGKWKGKMLIGSFKEYSSYYMGRLDYEYE